MPVKPIPDGYHSVTPYLIVSDAARAIDFYTHAFGASLTLRLDAPGGKIGHAELKIGDSIIMLADEFPEMGAHGPQTIGESPVHLHLYVADVDAVFARALSAGAAEAVPIKDHFYGDRSGNLTDPFGHSWTIATHVEDVSPDELARRSQDVQQH
jgi:PhnB protein